MWVLPHVPLTPPSNRGDRRWLRHGLGTARQASLQFTALISPKGVGAQPSLGQAETLRKALRTQMGAQD